MASLSDIIRTRLSVRLIGSGCIFVIDGHARPSKSSNEALGQPRPSETGSDYIAQAKRLQTIHVDPCS